MAEYLCTALLGSTLWWIFEHLTDKVIEQTFAFIAAIVHI
jgi:hypothetical protein